MATVNLDIPTTADPRCFHCNAGVTTHEIADGWCETCGKKIPDFLKGDIKRLRTPVPAADSYDEPAPGSVRRMLWSGLSLAAVSAGIVALIVSLNLR